MRRFVLTAIVIVAFGGIAALAWLLGARGGDGPPSDTAEVLFATNRHVTDAAEPGARFDGRRGEKLRYGRCTIGYEPIPLTTDLAASVDFHIPTRFQNVESVDLYEPEAFERLIASRGSSPVVLFVHGYSYGFDRTCRMGAGLQQMLGDQATLIMFSWPSDANPADYVADQVDMEWSVPALAGLMNRLRARVGPQRLRVLAHSLGTRGVLFALAWLDLERHEMPIADHLVLLAPDYDAAVFDRQFPMLERLVGRVTVYASDNDTPLSLSQTLHGHPRLGQGGEQLSIIDGVTTIDVSSLGRYHPSGHEYFSYHPIAAADLVESLVTGLPPGERTHTRERARDGQRYWVLSEAESSRR